jgi:hypothetical protein
MGITFEQCPDRADVEAQRGERFPFKRQVVVSGNDDGLRTLLVPIILVAILSVSRWGS